MALSLTGHQPASANVTWDSVRQWESATVVRIVDGDTLIVEDEVTKARSRIRMIGVNAPELAECGGWQAKALIESLAPIGTRLRLASASQTSTGRGRPLRVVLAKNSTTGEYDHDLAWALAERGLGVWFTQPQERTLSPLYRAVVDGAQAARLGIWSGQLCGDEEQPGAELSLRIGRGVKGDEWVTVRNTGSAAADISGWTLRDSGLVGRFSFPPGSVLVPGDWRTVHTGSGTGGLPDGHDLYASYDGSLYQQAQEGGGGDGAYLLDRAGDFRSWREYPCQSSCESYLQPVGIVAVRPAGEDREGWVRITSNSFDEVCLDGFVLAFTDGRRVLLGSYACLGPGESKTFKAGPVELHGQVILVTDTLVENSRAYW